jgi:sulfide:quinone oxidoreductase
MKKIVILGGGFAGIQAAIELQKSGMFKVTLVSDRDYLYIYPVSIWVPAHAVAFEDVRVPIPLPVVGHWMKKGWGTYSKLTKIGRFPRLPGL